MMEKPIIEAHGLKKIYRIGQIGGTTLQADLNALWARLRGRENPNLPIGTNTRLLGQTFYALGGVNFVIEKGEAIGIIGRNGAGKSTLLKILSRITAPSQGTAVLRGRITSMLEVGTGFNGEMTGRENVYMNGAILGMTRAEIDAKLEDIIAFSECADFIDTPVKRYSSGMYVKLAFSVAAHLTSEILIMDEVLAVGDAAFQKKCIDKMKDSSRLEGRTILYVSHNMATIRQLCRRCIVLDSGKVVFDGEPEKAIEIYMGDIFEGNVSRDLPPPTEPDPGVIFKNIRFCNAVEPKFETGDVLELELRWQAVRPLRSALLHVAVRSADGVPIGYAESTQTLNGEGGHDYVCTFLFSTANLPLGKYILDLMIEGQDDKMAPSINTCHSAIGFEIPEYFNKVSKRGWRRDCGSVVLPTLIVSSNKVISASPSSETVL